MKVSSESSLPNRETNHLTGSAPTKLDPRQFRQTDAVLKHSSIFSAKRESSAMRMVYLAVIFLLAAAAVIFAVQNLTSVGVSFFGSSVTKPLAVLVVVIYVLGAATGGSRFALFRSSYEGS